MGSPRHRLSQIDEMNKTALCLECGAVSIYKSPAMPRWRCRTAKWEHHGKHPKEWIKSKGERCEICGSSDRLKIDHDHKSNTFRGTLCHSCNVGLGFFKDDVVLLDKAKAYLLK